MGGISSRERYLLNKYCFGRGFFAAAFAFLPAGISTFLRLLGYASNDLNVREVGCCYHF